MSTERQDKERARQGRMAAIVIAVSALLSIGVNAGADVLGLSNRAVGLILLVAMAGFAFGLVVAIRIWLSGRKNEG